MRPPKKGIRMTRLTLIAAAALAFLAANAAQAQEYHSKDLTISNSWARPAGEGQYSAIYLTIKNAGQEADTFVWLRAPSRKKHRSTKAASKAA